MVHNMLTPLQNLDEINFWENIPFSGMIPEPQQVSPVIEKPMKRKVKRNRTAFTSKQLRTLELLYSQNKYISPERRRAISKSLNLGDKSVKIWFQNRRMKEKRESSESSRVDSDSSSENCCKESPPSPPPSTESYNSHQNENTALTQNEPLTPESYQYQVPNLYVNSTAEQQVFPNVHSNDYNAIQVNQMQYYNENNMYPTQYYPANENNYSNDYYNYYQYQLENSMNNSNWFSNYIAPDQYYCNEQE